MVQPEDHGNTGEDRGEEEMEVECLHLVGGIWEISVMMLSTKAAGVRSYTRFSTDREGRSRHPLSCSGPWGQEIGGRRQETGGRRQETGDDRRQEAGDDRRRQEDRSSRRRKWCTCPFPRATRSSGSLSSL